jgi:predicted DNA-binding transcriptional regulator AlpA
MHRSRRATPVKAAKRQHSSHRGAGGAELDLPVEGFLRLGQVLTIYPVSRSSWWEGIRAGLYPPPYRLGVRSVGWKTSDIRRLVDSASHSVAMVGE